MRSRGVFGIALFTIVFVAFLFVADPTLVAGNSNPSVQVSESLTIMVFCDNASVSIVLGVSSDNYTLIHFPSSVDMNDSHLENAVEVWVISNPLLSILSYGFEGISEGEARTNADWVTSSISTAFGVSFTHDSTRTIGTEVHVNYTGPGQSNMANFANSMVSACVDADVDGFSDAVPSLVAQTATSSLQLGADKESGDFEWTTTITLVFSSSIPTGTGSHIINVLDLLGVSSLAPSAYSFEGGVCESTVILIIYSTTSSNFVSCEPPETTDPSQRGWMHMQYGPTQLMAFFYFGDDPSSVAPLAFTFSGTVVPEFTPLTLMIILILTATCIIAFRRRTLQKKP